jgi:hypothetical protein
MDSLARSNEIIHPSGFKLRTPCLIPSFSSKGFESSIKKKSEAAFWIDFHKQFLEKYMLVSAYDIYHGFIPKPKQFVCTDITFVDSGGYESSPIFDSSSDKKINSELRDWKYEFLVEVYNKWDHKRYPAVFVNYDHHKNRRNILQQAKSASKLFKQYPEQLSDFLIKPESSNQDFLKVDNILNNITLLKDFDIIGFTEKELGKSICDRMTSLYRIRKKMDSEEIHKPIHVFGSLDPLSCVLYFLTGAEIFDGLTWLRYAYRDGISIYHSNNNVLNYDIHTEEKQNFATMTLNNIQFLNKLRAMMIDFLVENDFTKFENIGEFVSRNFQSFQNSLKKY